MADRETIQRAYTATVRHFMETGRAPHYTELARTLGLSPDAAREAQRGAAAAGPATWYVPETDYVASWAPFSNVPTQLRISIDGVQRWYGQ